MNLMNWCLTLLDLKKMVILGESAPRVKRAADKAGVPYVDATDVADATQKAFDLS